MAQFLGPAASLIGAGLNFFGNQSANAANNAFAYTQLQDQMDIANRNLQFQAEAAQQGIRWRVNDARIAGVSPLVALGAPTFNPSPVSLGAVPGPDQVNPAGGFGNVGQDISRAVQATMSAKERAEAQIKTDAMSKMQMDKMQADIDLTRAQTASVLARGAQGPAMPVAYGRTGLIEGQGNANAGEGGGYFNVPPKLTTENPSNPGIVSGPPSPMGIYRTNSAGALVYEDAPGTQASTIGGWTQTENWVRNRLLPYFRPSDAFGAPPPPRSMLPEGAADWRFDPGRGGWVPISNEDVVRRDIQEDRARRFRTRSLN